MYHSDQYMLVARSTATPGMDVFSVPSNMKEYMHTREEYLKNQTYKYVYIGTASLKVWDDMARIYFGEEVDAQGMLGMYYDVIEDPNMPESMRGRFFVAK